MRILAVRGAMPDQDRGVLKLKAGKNRLLLKVGNLQGEWAVYVAPEGFPESWPKQIRKQLQKDFPVADASPSPNKSAEAEHYKRYFDAHARLHTEMQILETKDAFFHAPERLVDLHQDFTLAILDVNAHGAIGIRRSLINRVRVGLVVIDHVLRSLANFLGQRVTPLVQLFSKEFQFLFTQCHIRAGNLRF